MTLIKSSVEPLPYKLLDFDQHSYEADDCFTRYMPRGQARYGHLPGADRQRP